MPLQWEAGVGVDIGEKLEQGFSFRIQEDVGPQKQRSVPTSPLPRDPSPRVEPEAAEDQDKEEVGRCSVQEGRQLGRFKGVIVHRDQEIRSGCQRRRR